MEALTSPAFLCELFSLVKDDSQEKGKAAKGSYLIFKQQKTRGPGLVKEIWVGGKRGRQEGLA